AKGLVSEAEYLQLENYTRKLFSAGSTYAKKQGLLLADTKYEFGKRDGKIMLIDEVHTPDSSRYFYAEGYDEHIKNGTTPKQLSKEFVREWLMENGFQGLEGQEIPEMTDEVVQMILNRYMELFEQITGNKFDIEANASKSADELGNKINAVLRDL
ncbi:MAG: phosphoribosylaminoimidazolesuccinocarboxamide synthase, partial [Sphingobacteriales bacterium]